MCEPPDPPTDPGDGDDGGGTWGPTRRPDETAENTALAVANASYGRAAQGSLIDPATGNLIEQYSTPAGGPLDPVVLLSYNRAYRGNSDEYPDGWTSSFKRRIDNSASPDVDVISGSGTAYRYESGGGTAYTAPEQAVNWLVGDGSGGWIETQPDGLKYYYDSTGKLTKLANHVGKVWTLTYTAGASGSLAITNPASLVTTLQYASSKLSAIIDADARRTTLTVSSNQLTKITSPELCETQFSYVAAPGNLNARVSPAGNRTTYSYDGSNRVTNVTYPGGHKTTYAYSTSAAVVTTVYTDQRGKVTTFVHTVSGTDNLLDTIVDPVGEITTLHYEGGKAIRSVESALNKRTTFNYNATFSEGVQLLEEIVAPSGPPTTYGYDTTVGAPPRIRTITDPRGKVTTLHWNSTANLKLDAVQNPLDHRTTYSYGTTGEITAVENPMNETFTYAYDSPDVRLRAVVDPLSKRHYLYL